MRTFQKMLLAALVSILATSCQQLSKSPQYTNEEIDEIVAQSVANAIDEPVFYSVEEVIEHQNFLIDKSTTDSVFITLPETTLIQIVNVLTKRGIPNITVKNVVDEYRAGQQIYDNLTPPNDVKQTIETVDLGATDLGTKRDSSNIISESYNYRTDTINGRAVRIKTKTTQSYE